MDVVTLGAALNGSKTYTDNAVAALVGGVHYKGSVNYYADLPNNASEGDAYTVKYLGTSGTDIDGGEYVWGYDDDLSDYAWISFSKSCYTKSEADTLLDGKADCGNDYLELPNGKRLYISSTAPTGNIPDGSIGVGW